MAENLLQNKVELQHKYMKCISASKQPVLKTLADVTAPDTADENNQDQATTNRAGENEFFVSFHEKCTNIKAQSTDESHHRGAAPEASHQRTSLKILDPSCLRAESFHERSLFRLQL